MTITNSFQIFSWCWWNLFEYCFYATKTKSLDRSMGFVSKFLSLKVILFFQSRSCSLALSRFGHSRRWFCFVFESDLPLLPPDQTQRTGFSQKRSCCRHFFKRRNRSQFWSGFSSSALMTFITVLLHTLSVSNREMGLVLAPGAEETHACSINLHIIRFLLNMK